MPIIKPISDLRNKSHEISKIVHEEGEPVFITRNGEGDMVVMSLAKYSQMELKLDLFKKLSAAEAQASEGDRGKDYKRVMKDLRKKWRKGITK